MIDNLITWLMKRLILLWDRHNDKLAFSFGRDERTDYSVLVERFYDDYYTVGTAMYPYNKVQQGGGKLMYEELVKRLRSHNGWALNKTLDEAADAIEKLQEDSVPIDDMEMILKEVVKPHWIPVKERLPECEWGSEVGNIEWISCGMVFAGCFGRGGKYRDAYFRTWTDGTEGIDAKSADYWRAVTLPEPPKEK